MSNHELPPEFLKLLETVTRKRPRVVIDHILEHGFITTEDLKVIYGYNHPPRAARDVRDEGIPLETFYVRGSDGRKIAAYRFGNPDDLLPGRTGGRSTFPKQFKISLFAKQQGRCAICMTPYESRLLQIDHKTPYLVGGESEARGQHNIEDYMLLCGSDNRAKSWSCEHCKNGTTVKDSSTCTTCYWHSPENYTHIATLPLRRLDLIWLGDEVHSYERLKKLAEESNQDVREYIKKLLNAHTDEDQ